MEQPAVLFLISGDNVALQPRTKEKVRVSPKRLAHGL